MIIQGTNDNDAMIGTAMPTRFSAHMAVTRFMDNPATISSMAKTGMTIWMGTLGMDSINSTGRMAATSQIPSKV